MELNREHFSAIIFYNFRCRLLNNSALMNLIQFLAMKLYQGLVFIDGMMNSIEVVVHSKMNFVKVVQNQFLFRKPLMMYANCYCKIVMWAIMRLRQP